jgi:hypothetical protein
MSAIAPINSSAIQGIERGLGTMRKAATDIARGSLPAQAPERPTDYARSLVQLHQGATQVKASARALKAYHEASGALLDILA